MKLSKHLCLECSTRAMFFNSSFIFSMMARFLNSCLSGTLIKATFILLLSLVISCMPSTNRRRKRFLPIYPLSANNFPYMNSTKVLYSGGFLSSTSPGVIMKLSNSPFLLQIRCSLKPKNHPMEHLPLCVIPLNTLWICILWFLHTLRGVLSAKPINDFIWLSRYNILWELFLCSTHFMDSNTTNVLLGNCAT